MWFLIIIVPEKYQTKLSLKKRVKGGSLFVQRWENKKDGFENKGLCSLLYNVRTSLWGLRKDSYDSWLSHASIEPEAVKSKTWKGSEGIFTWKSRGPASQRATSLGPPPPPSFLYIRYSFSILNSWHPNKTISFSFNTVLTIPIQAHKQWPHKRKEK